MRRQGTEHFDGAHGHPRGRAGDWLRPGAPHQNRLGVRGAPRVLVLVVQATEGLAQHAALVGELCAFQLRRQVFPSQSVQRGCVGAVGGLCTGTVSDVFHFDDAVVIGNFDRGHEAVGECSMAQLGQKLGKPLQRLSPDGSVERTHAARHDGDLHMAVVVPTDGFPDPGSKYVCRGWLGMVGMQR